MGCSDEPRTGAPAPTDRLQLRAWPWLLGLELRLVEISPHITTTTARSTECTWTAGDAPRARHKHRQRRIKMKPMRGAWVVNLELCMEGPAQPVSQACWQGAPSGHPLPSTRPRLASQMKRLTPTTILRPVHGCTRNKSKKMLDRRGQRRTSCKPCAWTSMLRAL